MYAVIKTGGKQYVVRNGEALRVEKLPGEVGSEFAFDEVLMFSDGDNVKVGKPILDNISVKARILEQGKEKKILVFKYKRRKRYRRKHGHRQMYTGIKIDSIEDGDSSSQGINLTDSAAESRADNLTEQGNGA